MFHSVKYSSARTKIDQFLSRSLVKSLIFSFYLTLPIKYLELYY